ncbi:MAG TPA: cation transporter [Acidimicrobiales bacterium]
MWERTYSVSGMTCDHCAQAITSELKTLADVTEVEVDLAAGFVRVVSSEELDDAAVGAAVEDAGYEVVG